MVITWKFFGEGVFGAFFFFNQYTMKPDMEITSLGQILHAMNGTIDKLEINPSAHQQMNGKAKCGMYLKWILAQSGAGV